MAQVVAGIALPEGEPDAIFDAARRLEGIASAFDGAARTVGRGVTEVGSWQGTASDGFRTLAASYEGAGHRAAGVLREGVVAVRRYGREFRDAYEEVKRLQREAEDCMLEIEAWERRRDAAADREASARQRASSAMFSGAFDPSGAWLAEQASALHEADAAAAERQQAEQRLAELRDRLERLRRAGERERERAIQAEEIASRQVLASADAMPVVQGPGAPGTGAVGGGAGPAYTTAPAVYRGGARTMAVDFDIGDILDFSRDVDREMGPIDEKIYEGGQAVEGAGREVLGFNDAEKSWDALRRGDFGSALFHGVLAWPGFGKVGKGVKEVGEEAAEQLGKQATKGLSDEASEAIAKRAAEKGVTLKNGHLAGSKHPDTGVPFKNSGFPDFSSYADDAGKQLGKPTTVEVDGITGKYADDFALANKAAGFEKTPKGFTWHHVEDCRHMQLVPQDVHRKTGHSGCVQLLKNGVVEP